MNLGSRNLAAAAIAMLMTTVAYAADDAVGEVEINDKLISFSGSGHQRTIACDGRKLEVVGTDHVVTATGVCAAVEITGVGNNVTVAVAPKGRLDIVGTDHTVRWKSDGKISQSVTGTGHRITRVK